MSPSPKSLRSTVLPNELVRLPSSFASSSVITFVFHSPLFSLRIISIPGPSSPAYSRMMLSSLSKFKIFKNPKLYGGGAKREV